MSGSKENRDASATNPSRQRHPLLRVVVATAAAAVIAAATAACSDAAGPPQEGADGRTAIPPPTGAAHATHTAQQPTVGRGATPDTPQATPATAATGTTTATPTAAAPTPEPPQSAPERATPTPPAAPTAEPTGPRAEVIPGPIQPGPDWQRVSATPREGREAFSLMLPPGWTVRQLRGRDSYVGEIAGDGAVLRFDYGWFSRRIGPDGHHEYLVLHEDIGGRSAKLLIAVHPHAETNAPYPATTGVFFEAMKGEPPAVDRLTMTGEGLSAQQQEIAVAIFRTILPGGAHRRGAP